MTPEHSRADRDGQLEKMELIFEAERTRHGYGIDDPVEPIRNKSGPARLLLSIVFTAVLATAAVFAVSLIASQNCGVPIDLGMLFA